MFLTQYWRDCIEKRKIIFLIILAHRVWTFKGFFKIISLFHITLCYVFVFVSSQIFDI